MLRGEAERRVAVRRGGSGSVSLDGGEEESAVGVVAPIVIAVVDLGGEIFPGGSGNVVIHGQGLHVAAQVGRGQYGQGITSLGSVAAGVDGGIAGVREKRIALPEPSGSDAGRHMQVFAEVGASGEIQVIRVIVRVQARASRERVGA